MANVTFGNRPLTSTPDGILNPHKNHDALAFLLFDAYVSMGNIREQAIALWRRREAIHRRLDEGSIPPDMKKVHARLHHIEKDLIDAEVSFLRYERSVMDAWRMTTIDQRQEEAIDAMFNVPATIKALPPLWWHEFGHWPVPAEGMRLEVAALLVSSPSQIKSYGGKG